MTAGASMLAQALAYAEHGLRVFPCVPGEKRPITPRGHLDATTDPDRIRGWWSLTTLANIAAPTGHPGFDVLDVDVRTDGSGWAAYQEARAAGLLDGWIRAVRTPSGGLHLHFPGTEQRNGSVRGQHLDFRGRGGYVLLPPSLVRTSDYVGSYEVIATGTGPGRPLNWAAVAALLTPTPPRFGLREFRDRPGGPGLIPCRGWPRSSPASRRATGTTPCSGPAAAPRRLVRTIWPRS